MRGSGLALVVLVACWQPSRTQTTTLPPGPDRPPPSRPARAEAREFLAVWGDNRTPSPQGNHQLFGTRMRADGTIVDPGGLPLDTRPQWASPTARVGATTKGWWVVSQYTDRKARTWSVSAQQVASTGALVGAPVAASAGFSDRLDFDAATAGDDVLVAWAGMRRTRTEAVLIHDGTPTSIALPTNSGRRPAVAYDPASDNFVLVYREASSATLVMIDRGGAVRTNVAITTPMARVDDGVRLAANGAGEVLATWVEADEQTITGARIDVANAQVTSQGALRTAGRTVLRHRLVRARRGYVLAWLEQAQRVGAAWLDGGDPLGVTPRDITLPITLPDEVPELQALERSVLVTWSRTLEPHAVRIDDSGTLVDQNPISLRTLRTDPIPAATLQASLDVIDRNGADYCPSRGHGAVPGTVRGLYVVEGTQPWGTLYIPGFGWGGSTGSTPRQSFYVGRQSEFVPHFKAQPGTAHPFELTVEIPDTQRTRTERIPVDPSDAAASAAAGITGAINLVDFEANHGLGGRGLHFVVTKTTVVEDTKTLTPRFTAGRAAFDKLLAKTRKDIDRTLAEAKRAALKANPHPIVKGTVPPAELVIYLPTYRPLTGQIEILFGYRVTNGVMMKFPTPKRDPNQHVKRPDNGPPPPNPRPLQWSVMMGARYTFEGDKLVREDVWAPTIVGGPGLQTLDVPWACRPPQGHAQQANVPACAGPAPTPKHTCERDCGGPVERAGDPPPGWSWLSPAELQNRRLYGCPICLPGSARISTPDGDIEIAKLQVGARIFTVDASGKRVAATVMHAGSTLAPATHRVVRVELSDGRVVSGSPDHPTARGRLGELEVGDELDHARVTRVERVPLVGDRTWDVLPSGSTGLYIVDGVVLRSSFAR